MTNRRVPLWVEQYENVPFVEGGRDKEKGLDCWGLCQVVAKEQGGLVLPEYVGVAARASLKPRTRKLNQAVADFIEEQLPAWSKVELGQEQPFDCVLIRMAGINMHISIVTAKGWMLHTESGCCSVSEKLNSIHWKNRIVGIYRYNGTSTTL